MPVANCHLCGALSTFQNSHVVPAFVFRWLRETSGNGYMRANQNPNRRIQDGPKEYWLCLSCETNFNRSETAFATQVFYPYLKASDKPLRYGNWLLHFCTSVSWRTLHYHTVYARTNGLGSRFTSSIQLAESTWREFLLGKIAHPGVFRQHIVLMDRVESASMTLPPNINRYLMRAVQIDLCQGGETLFTYSKLGRFMILGFINEPQPGNWVGSKVNANRGEIGPRNYSVPLAFMRYLIDKANELMRVNVSRRQQEKINVTFKSNIDKLKGSDFFEAMYADVEMFGALAFQENQDRPSDDDH